MAAAEALLERVIADSHEVTEGGEFLPLGVWGVRGFDIEAIRTLTIQKIGKLTKCWVKCIECECYRLGGCKPPPRSGHTA